MPEEVSQVSTASSSVNTAEALERPAALGRCSSHQGRAVKVRQAYRFALDPSPAGKEAVSSRTRWRLPADHPDALPQGTQDGVVRVLNSPPPCSCWSPAPATPGSPPWWRRSGRAAALPR